MNFSKVWHFLKNVSRFKARYKKTMRFAVYVWGSVRNFFSKMCNTEANIEYFTFLNCCNLTPSQIEIIIKFLKNFEKEGLNFCQMTLCEGFSYCSEILWLLPCVAKTSSKNKNKDNMRNIWIKIYWYIISSSK